MTKLFVLTFTVFALMALTCASAFAQFNNSAPTVYQGSAFVNRVETYVTVGTDIITLKKKGNFSIPLQAWTGLGVKDGAGVVGSDLALKYDFQKNSSVYVGIGLPVPYNKLTLSDFSSSYIGFNAGLQFQFSIAPASSPKSATVIDSADRQQIGSKILIL